MAPGAKAKESSTSPDLQTASQAQEPDLAVLVTILGELTEGLEEAKELEARMGRAVTGEQPLSKGELRDAQATLHGLETRRRAYAVDLRATERRLHPSPTAANGSETGRPRVVVRMRGTARRRRQTAGRRARGSPSADPDEPAPPWGWRQLDLTRSRA